MTSGEEGLHESLSCVPFYKLIRYFTIKTLNGKIKKVQIENQGTGNYS